MHVQAHAQLVILLRLEKKKRKMSERQEDIPSAGKRVCVCVWIWLCVRLLPQHPDVCVPGEYCALCEKVNSQWFHLLTWHIVWPLWSRKYTHTHTRFFVFQVERVALSLTVISTELKENVFIGLCAVLWKTKFTPQFTSLHFQRY